LCSLNKFAVASVLTTLSPDVVALCASKVDDYDEAGRRRASHYTCNLCQYTARDRYNVKIHLEGKHGLGSYNCPHCAKHLKTKQDLSRHILTGCPLKRAELF
jgi:predicted SprT family Zn-dependent metalloprotease